MSKDGSKMRGMYSYNGNPLKMPAMVPKGVGGGGSSPEKSKIDAAVKKQYAMKEKNRGL